MSGSCETLLGCSERKHHQANEDDMWVTLPCHRTFIWFFNIHYSLVYCYLVCGCIANGIVSDALGVCRCALLAPTAVSVAAVGVRSDFRRGGTEVEDRGWS